jgi:hypothetical protein
LRGFAILHALHPIRWRCLTGEYALPRIYTHHIQAHPRPRPPAATLRLLLISPNSQPPVSLPVLTPTKLVYLSILNLSIRLHGQCCPNSYEVADCYPLAVFYLMGQLYSTLTRPTLTTQVPLPWEVVPGGIRIKTQEWVCPPGCEQARPACFGDSQLPATNRSGNDRLCSICMSLGHLESTHWDSINNFREVVVKHHHSVSALLESVRRGCHCCGLLLIAWEENCRLYQEPGGGWTGKADFDSVSLDGDIRLRYQRVRTTISLTGDEVDEVQITILCGGLQPGMSGRLICKPMDCERPSFLQCHQFLTINQRGSQSYSSSRNMPSYRE